MDDPTLQGTVDEVSAQDPERHLRELVHDMRVPVASLAAAVELLDENDTTDAARAAVAHLRALMKWAEAAYAPRCDGSPGEVDLMCLVRDAEKTLRPILKAKNLSLRISGETAVVRGEPLGVSRVLLNVLGNAARYAPPDSPIDVTIEQGTGTWICLVRDYGPGFTSDSPEQHGWGMGLPLSRELISGMGGSLDVSSRSDGVRVTLRLPAAE